MLKQKYEVFYRIGDGQLASIIIEADVIGYDEAGQLCFANKVKRIATAEDARTEHMKTSHTFKDWVYFKQF